MSAKLLQHPHWLALERLRTETEKLCRQHGDQACRATPPKGGWSVLQILEHIILSESGTLHYMKKKLSYSDTLKKATPVAFLRLSLLRAALRSPFRFRAPEVVNPPEKESPFSLNDILEQWTQLRKEFQLFLEQFPENQESKLVFRHPVAGRLTLLHTLSFMRDHLNRHARQIQSRLSDSGQAVRKEARSR